MSQDNVIAINGNICEIKDGDTILDIATRNGIYIPTLCYLKDTTPTGACRMCLVEVEGARGLAVACAMPASPGMVVHTDSPKVISARRYVLAFLMVSGNHNCAARGHTESDWTDFQLNVREYDDGAEICDAYGSCVLQELAYKYQVADLIEELRLSEKEIHYDIEMANPFIIRDFSRCILCGRCIKACNEVQVNNAISFGYRGGEAKIVTGGDMALADSDCVFCGQCLQVCPVGALTLKDQRYDTRFWDLDKVESTCVYCGTGCSIDLYVKDGKVVKVSGTENGIVNSGSLCVKGRFGNDFIHHPERLTKPLIKEAGGFREAEWDEALKIIADKLQQVKKDKGPDAIAALSSARCTNEENYIMQKFFRAVVGTNSIDHCARL